MLFDFENPDLVIICQAVNVDGPSLIPDGVLSAWVHLNGQYLFNLSAIEVSLSVHHLPKVALEFASVSRSFVNGDFVDIFDKTLKSQNAILVILFKNGKYQVTWRGNIIKDLAELHLKTGRLDLNGSCTLTFPGAAPVDLAIKPNWLRVRENGFVMPIRSCLSPSHNK